MLLTKNSLAKNLSTLSTYSNYGALNVEQIKHIFNCSWKYDSGKYEPSLRNKQLLIETDEPIWYETRSCSDGQYLQLLCVDDNKLSKEERLIYDQIIDLWQTQEMGI